MSSDRTVVIVDLETTGLDPESGHEPWEYGLLVRRLSGGYPTEILWRTMPDLAKADPGALQKNRYYERTAAMPATWQRGDIRDLAELGPPLVWSDPELVARKLARVIDRTVVIGANPGFDKDFLRPFLARHGHAYTAHYRPLCITTMAYGWLCARGAAGGLSWPLSSDEVSRAVGVDPDKFDRHTALGDCRWTAAQLNVITGAGGAYISPMTS